MSDRKEQILSRLREERAETILFFQGLEDTAWKTQIYEAGPEWDARQIFCHVVETEEHMRRLIESIVDGGEGVPEEFSIDRFNNSKVSKMDGVQPAELFGRFETNRAAMIAMVEKMEDADFDKMGRHPFLGMERIERILKLVYRHVMLHQRDITRALDAGHPIPASD
jgi:DinB family protein